MEKQSYVYYRIVRYKRGGYRGISKQLCLTVKASDRLKKSLYSLNAGVLYYKNVEIGKKIKK
jgi:hypothetical protein